MDIYEHIGVAFAELPGVGQWDEVLDLFQRVTAQKPAHWLLPLRACEAVGGEETQAVPAATAIACSHLSIILVDDMLDCDPRGEYRRAGAPAAANMASALQAAASASIARATCAPGNRLAALECLNRMTLTTTLGQHWDVEGAPCLQCLAEDARYWQVVRAKSSPFFGAALQIGALLGGASIPLAAQLRELGELYGEMIQIHDDLSDSLSAPANPDWLQGRLPLPILFARLVEHPDRERFVALCDQIAAVETATLRDARLAEAQDILVTCGAVSYCVEKLLQRGAAMRAILETTPLRERAGIEALVEAVIAPVTKLFEELDD